ncbi:pyrroline-5-carboxylate reductase 1 [Anastrepha obliqua]|uniref:pyrroline-5-carboxylate reductase 1 n=1 Tax=Anastrepha obliqua TaxID=95512 RepID=UPI002409E742|nr:pyrroline-5-carboxylate reductase 1 [Anastrepha obliqua]
MAKIILICLLSVLACVSGQRITTIHLDGVQYFISRMNPYSPELNYFLAYQYCRSLGLQLASFETKEKAESMTTYLKNAGYGNYDFWTSGNRLGTGMFLWMSTGLPFNATFDFFENSADAIQAGLLDPVDHNSNTSPQRTARDSSSGAEKGCVILKQPTLKWMPEDCSAVKDFICEQTRCYYYNYGSIPVSSAQGRPVTSTTSRPTVDLTKLSLSTTPLPLTMSTYTPFSKRSHQDDHDEPQLSFVSLNLDHDLESAEEEAKNDEHEHEHQHEHEHEHDNFDAEDEDEDDKKRTLPVYENNNLHAINKESVEQHAEQEAHQDAQQEGGEEEEDETANEENISVSHEDSSDDVDTKSNSVGEHQLKTLPVPAIAAPAEVPTVEVRLKQISQEIEKMAAANSENQRHNNAPVGVLHHDNNDVDRQSFLSLTDLIRTLRPNNKQIIPQIDSDYSNAMRVLGETSEVVNNEEAHKFYDKDMH